MPKILGSFPAALIAARNNMSANAFYRTLQQLDMGARRGEVLALYKVARDIISRETDEPFRPISQIPSPGDLTPWPTVSASGVRQTVAIVYREKATGHISRVWWSTVTPNGITRERAMATAIGAYQEHAEAYNQELIGAVHAGAHELVPMS